MSFSFSRAVLYWKEVRLSSACSLCLLIYPVQQRHRPGLGSSCLVRLEKLSLEFFSAWLRFVTTGLLLQVLPLWKRRMRRGLCVGLRHCVSHNAAVWFFCQSQYETCQYFYLVLSKSKLSTDLNSSWVK